MMTYGTYHSGCFGRVFFLAIVFSCWPVLCLLAQPGQLDFRHYTIDDGLPSSEVYVAFEDKDGFMWLGTDNGIARFDGYEFTTFDADEGLEDVVVFNIIEDDGGRLWLSTYSGRFFYFEDGRFHPYIHNDIAIELKNKSQIVKLLDITDDEEMIIHVKGSKIVKITPAGEVVPLTTNQSRSDTNYVYLTERTTSVKNVGAANTLYAPQIPPPSDGNISLRVQGEDSINASTNFKFTRGVENLRLWYAGILERSGSAEVVLANQNEVIISTLNDEKTYQFPTELGKVITYVLPGKNEGEYWFFFNRGHGLEHYEFFAGSDGARVTSFLKGHSVSSGLFDANGGFWVTTLDDGVYFSPYPEQKIYLKDDVTQNVKSISLALTGPEEFYAGYDDGSIFRYDKDGKGLWDVLHPEIINNERMFDLFYDSANSRLYTSFYHFKHPLKVGKQLKNNVVTRYSFDNFIGDNFTYFNYLPDLNPGVIYATRGLSFAELNISGDTTEFYSFKLGLKFNGAHVLATDAQGRRLLGTLNGLYEITPDGRMVPDNLGVKELSGRVVFIKPVNKEALLFGTRGNGLIYYGQDTSYLIRESNGLASDMIRHIHKNEKGVFWISTLNGLSKVSFSADGHHYQLRTFRTENGLPSNEVSQTDTWGDAVWLATSVGITHFVEPPVDSLSPAPNIREVKVNGEIMPALSYYALPAGKQRVNIDFGTINYFLGDKVLYRYRIAEEASWQESYDRSVSFPSLSPGTYRFAVQSRNQDGFWSESTYLDIYVATPWYATWWALACGALLLIGGVSTFFLIRERRRKREQNFLLQINELEHAALHAQMNPHFVFNALNSIQNFVLENDAKQAATYLSRFASIIRQTLRSSVEGKHTLREEMDVLKTYLVLEKLRFKEGFSYELTVSPDLPLDAIKLPPLLIQPFVENAILHGLEDKTGGKISVAFTGSAEVLYVHVEDNGKGFDPTSLVKKDSLGMDITQRRLRMMNKELKEQSGMNVEAVQDGQGNICGTRINLVIKLENG